jgi:putative ABC transport system ATP-binding protein
MSRYQPAVVCRGLVKDFSDGSGTLRVLHDINVRFPNDALSLLVGPSGCGKTTLISIIAGVLGATAGTVDVFDERVTGLDRRALVRYRRDQVGFVFQQYHLLPTLTAAENAAVPLAAAGVSRRAAVDRARAMLDRLGMGPHAAKLPAQLSGGQQQRVAIARALVHEPRLVVCDEPTAALDAAAGHRVMELLRDIAVGPGRACLVVTHDHRIFEFADCIATMEDGRMASVRRTSSTLHEVHP